MILTILYFLFPVLFITLLALLVKIPVFSAIFFICFFSAILILAIQNYRKEIVLLLTITGLATFFGNFAHISIPPNDTAIYLTEACICFCVTAVLYLFFSTDRHEFTAMPLQLEFFIFGILFLASFIKGIFIYSDVMYVIRQSALFYYSIFFFLTPVLLDSFARVRIFLKLIFILYCIIPIATLLNFHHFGIGSFSYFVSSITLIFESIYINLIKNALQKYVFLFAILIQLAVVILTQARAAWMGLFAAVLFLVFLLSKRYFSIKQISLTVKYFIISFSFIMLIMLVFKPAIIHSLSNEFLSIFLINNNKSAADISVTNAKWRLYVWKDILKESMEKPILGWGFGKKFIPETVMALNWGGSWQDPKKLFQDPHNSYLSFLHSTGFLGLFSFLFIIFSFFKRYLNFLKQMKDGELKMLVLSCLTAIVFVLGTSFFMVILELPYLGISLWFLMGLTVSLENIYRKKYKYAKS